MINLRLVAKIRARAAGTYCQPNAMIVLHCPTCGTPLTSKPARNAPFCSPRCQQIDLGRWLNEEFGLPVEEGQDQDELLEARERNN